MFSKINFPFLPDIIDFEMLLSSTFSNCTVANSMGCFVDLSIITPETIVPFDCAKIAEEKEIEIKKAKNILRGIQLFIF